MSFLDRLVNLGWKLAKPLGIIVNLTVIAMLVIDNEHRKNRSRTNQERMQIDAILNLADHATALGVYKGAMTVCEENRSLTQGDLNSSEARVDTHREYNNLFRGSYDTLLERYLDELDNSRREATRYSQLNTSHEECKTEMELVTTTVADQATQIDQCTTTVQKLNVSLEELRSIALKDILEEADSITYFPAGVPELRSAAQTIGKSECLAKVEAEALRRLSLEDMNPHTLE